MTTTATTERKAANRPQEGAEFRLLHTMIRVLESRRSRWTSTLAFIGYGDESDHTVIELTHNWDQKEPYSIGTGYGHMAIGVPDIFGVCERMRASSVKIIREPGPMKHGTTVIAFIEDPDGYKVELIERK